MRLFILLFSNSVWYIFNAGIVCKTDSPDDVRGRILCSNGIFSTIAFKIDEIYAKFNSFETVSLSLSHTHIATIDLTEKLFYTHTDSSCIVMALDGKSLT